MTPLRVLPIKTWIYMDALPNIKAGFEEDNYSKKSYYLDDVIREFKKDDFEKDRHLTSYLLFHYIENIKFIWLKNEGRTQVEKVKVSNLLEYHYLENKQAKNYFKSLKDLPTI